MNLQQEKEQTIQILSDVMKKPYIRNYPKTLHGMQDLSRDIQGDFYTVVVLGEFKRGKSTLVNALLGNGVHGFYIKHGVSPQIPS